MKQATTKILSCVLAIMMMIGTVVVGTSAASCTHTSMTVLQVYTPKYCTEAGYTVYKCNLCGEIHTIQTSEPERPDGLKITMDDVVAVMGPGYVAGTDPLALGDTSKYVDGSVATCGHAAANYTGPDAVAAVYLAGYKCLTCGLDTTVYDAGGTGAHNFEMVKAITEPSVNADGKAVNGQALIACTFCGTSYVAAIRCAHESDASYLADDFTGTPDANIWEAKENKISACEATITYTCKTCGYVGATVKDTAIDHVYAYGSFIEQPIAGTVGCEAAVYRAGICTVCGYKVNEIVTSGKSHVRNAFIAAAGSHADKTYYTVGEVWNCYVCHENYERVAATAHTFKTASVTVIVDASLGCLAANNMRTVTYQYCTTCCKTLNTDLGKATTSAAVDTQLTKVYTSAACTDYKVTEKNGVKVNQGFALISDKTFTATAHTNTTASGKQLGTLTALSAIECTETVDSFNKCKYCDYNKNGDEDATLKTSKKGTYHSEYNFKSQTAATCLADSTTIFACAACGAESKKTGAVTQAVKNSTQTAWGAAALRSSKKHTYDAGNGDKLVYLQQPTHDAAGSRKFICGKCNETITESISKQGHTYTNREINVDLDPNACIEAVYTLGNRQCTVCDAYYLKDGYKAAEGHNYVAATAVTDPSKYVCGKIAIDTITTPGSAKYCTKCGDAVNCTTHEVVHNYVVVNSFYGAACANVNYTLYECDICNDRYVDDYIALDEHTLVKGATTAATCGTEGYTEYTCSVCAAVFQLDKVAALGHKNAAGEALTVNCDSKNVTDRMCVNCNAAISLLDASNPAFHLDEKWNSPIHTNADCLSAETNVYNCTACGESKIEVLNPALGHDKKEVVGEDGKTITVVCDRCKLILSASTVNANYGDVNGDGIVNAKDLATLRHFLAADGTVTSVSAGADANGDGAVTAKDLVVLRNYLANGDISVLGPQTK